MSSLDVGSPAGDDSPADFPPPYDGVVFDCDSTLSAIEGVDELAPAGSPERARVEALTNDAMSGRTPLDEVYGRRLELLRPDRARLERLGRAYVEALVPGARELVRGLLRLGKHVAIVSGGLRPAVLAVAAELGLDERDVHAVDLVFDPGGGYADYDRASPLARSGGKLEVVRDLARAHPALALVGDGITDLEAAPALRRFVAFGGVVRRTEVFERARVGSDTPSLLDLQPLLLTASERATLA